MRTALVRAAWAARSRWQERYADVCGASLVEYALVLALVSVAAITALGLIGRNASTVLSAAAASISS